MKKYSNVGDYIRKSKFGFAGLLFLLFLVNREITYCHFFGYACHEELESTIPYVIIIIYFAIVGVIFIISKIVFAKSSKSYVRNIILKDYVIEMAFYATSIMLLRSESWYPYLILRIFIYIIIDLLLMFFVFRNGFSSKQNDHDSASIRIPFINYLIVTIISLLGYLSIVSTVPWLYRMIFCNMD